MNFRDILDTEFHHNSVLTWLQALGVLAFIITFIVILFYLTRHLIRKVLVYWGVKFNEKVIERANKPLLMYTVFLAVEISARTVLEFPESSNFQQRLDNTIYTLLTLNTAWLIVRILEVVVERYLLPLTHKNNSRYTWLIPIIKRIIKTLIWSIAIIEALSNAGYDVAALLTGLGIGGIAIAIAAKSTLMNIIGGIYILFVQPFRIGDRILIDNYDGIVEDIGLSTTFVRRFIDNTVIAIPNKIFSDTEVVNITRADGVRCTFILHLPLKTEAIKLHNAVAHCEQAIAEAESTKEKHFVGIKKIGDFGIELEVIFYALPSFGVWKARTEVATKILAAFQKEGIGLLIKSWAADGFNYQPEIVLLDEDKIKAKKLADKGIHQKQEDDDFGF
ncbi:MAG: mechanosensitive ion channel [Bernardetiaceae bacterium]|nr:mechanosensitive ion channel [Bernardetiaceae bacterium]